jgi:hypothetical protein
MRLYILAVLLCASSSFLQSSGIDSLATSTCAVTENSIFRTCAAEKTQNGTLAKEDLTIESFAVGEATLDDLSHRFPGVKRFRLTREEESPVGICVKNTQGQAVVFASGSSGAWDVLDSAYIARASTVERLGATCMTEPSLPSKLSTESGISLGMQPRQLLALLHSTGAISNSTFQINFTTSPAKAPWAPHRLQPTQGEGWEALSGAIGEFHTGRLEWIELYAGVSN